MSWIKWYPIGAFLYRLWIPAAAESGRIMQRLKWYDALGLCYQPRILSIRFFLKYVVMVKMLRCYGRRHEGFFCMSNSGFGQPWGGRWVTVAAETGENFYHFFAIFCLFFTCHFCQRTFLAWENYLKRSINPTGWPRIILNTYRGFSMINDYPLIW